MIPVDLSSLWWDSALDHSHHSPGFFGNFCQETIPKSDTTKQQLSPSFFFFSPHPVFWDGKSPTPLSHTASSSTRAISPYPLANPSWNHPINYQPWGELIKSMEVSSRIFFPFRNGSGWGTINNKPAKMFIFLVGIIPPRLERMGTGIGASCLLFQAEAQGALPPKKILSKDKKIPGSCGWMEDYL